MMTENFESLELIESESYFFFADDFFFVDFFIAFFLAAIVLHPHPNKIPPGP
jgi:hypothetical protein